MKSWQFVNSLLDRIFVVAGALLGSQIPEFMQQYSQRLAGHADELKRLLDNLKVTAAQSHRTLEEYIQKFLQSSDHDFMHQGQFMEGMLNRWRELHEAFQTLTQSALWERPFVFFKHLQSDIFQATLSTYQPGINLSVEGLFYIGLGTIMGYASYHLIIKCLQVGYSQTSALFKPSL